MPSDTTFSLSFTLNYQMFKVPGRNFLEMKLSLIQLATTQTLNDNYYAE